MPRLSREKLVVLTLIALACGGQWVGSGPLVQAVHAAQATPWADRGWVDEGNMTYDNPTHGFHLTIPPNWSIDPENAYNTDKILWAMRRSDAAGNPRLALLIQICPCQPKTAAEFFNDELAGYKKQYQVVSSGPTVTPGVYEILMVLPNAFHARELFFLHKTKPYIVGFQWASDATAAELADLDGVRGVMGLPPARTK